MAANKDTTLVTVEKTNVELFLDERVEKGKLTEVEAKAVIANLEKQSKKDSSLTGKTVASLKAAEQQKLLEVMAIRAGLADKNGVLL